MRGESRNMHRMGYFLGEQIKKNQMDGAGTMYVGQESCIQGFGGET